MAKKKVEAVNDELTAQEVKKENGNLNETEIGSVSGGAYYTDGAMRGVDAKVKGKRYSEIMEQTLKKGAVEGLKRLGELNADSFANNSQTEEDANGRCATLVKEGKDKI